MVEAGEFGAENDEAIAGGAYWFYWRLGFRPREMALRARAEREAARLVKSRTKKSSAATLRALAHGTLELVLPGGGSHPYFPDSFLVRCAHGAARLLEHTHPHDHRAAATKIAFSRAATDQSVTGIARRSVRCRALSSATGLWCRF